MRRFTFYIILLTNISLLGISCKKTKVPEVTKIKVQVLHFEKDLFTCDVSKLQDSIPFLKKKYGEFFEMFNHKIINIGSSSNPAYTEYLRGFLTDYDMNQVYEAIDSVYKNFTPIENQITDVFSYVKYYFPNIPIPVVITYMSGFNQSMVSSDTILGIGLDRYLGRNSPFYTRLGYANYMTQNMIPEKIPSDCAKAWAMTQFSMNPEQNTLISHMVYQGKILYFTKNILPYAADSLVTGFSNSQLDWCTKNEGAMWAFLIENKLLFNSENGTIIKYIGEAPFTKGFGRYSPGKAACWIGYRIVSKYMEQNTKQTLAGLMAENDFQKILRESKYKP